jgi:hypothetical protein
MMAITEENDKKITSNIEKKPEVRIGKRLIEILDNLLTNGDWDSSLFLKTIKKRIQDIIDETHGIMDKGESEALSIESMKDKFNQPLPKGYIRVYILLYQIEGNKIASWQSSLKILLTHSSSRPTYKNESHIQELVRSKKDIEHYGYAVVNIVENGIYEQERLPKDVLGHEMVMLKDGMLKRENIIGFVHANKRRYNFADGELVFQDNV